MNSNKIDSALREFPSALLAVFTLIGATFVLFGVGESIEQYDRGSYAAYILNGLIISAGCFFIIRSNPKSIFYTPLISNALVIVAALIEPNFWITPMWIPICSGWVLTVIVSLLAFRIGKRNSSQTNA